MDLLRWEGAIHHKDHYAKALLKQNTTRLFSILSGYINNAVVIIEIQIKNNWMGR